MKSKNLHNAYFVLVVELANKVRNLDTDVQDWPTRGDVCMSWDECAELLDRNRLLDGDKLTHQQQGWLRSRLFRDGAHSAGFGFHDGVKANFGIFDVEEKLRRERADFVQAATIWLRTSWLAPVFVALLATTTTATCLNQLHDLLLKLTIGNAWQRIIAAATMIVAICLTAAFMRKRTATPSQPSAGHAACSPPE